MKRELNFPAPALQTDFAFALNDFRATCLQNALFETLKSMKIKDIDKQLARYVPPADLALMAQRGLRGELLFPVPLILEKNPRLLGYYRLLLGYSQKEFYGKDKFFGTGVFKSMETVGQINAAASARLPALCGAFCEAASALLRGIKILEPGKEFLDDLTLLTLGPQLRGGMNNRRGQAGIKQIFAVIKKIVHATATTIKTDSIEILNAAGRKVVIAFAQDPDITIREELSPNEFRNVVAIEIKSGQDRANIHNRLGEAEKSHQKARADDYTECWTIVNVDRLDAKKAKAESPSTDRFYSLKNIVEGSGEEWKNFRQRITALTAIPDGGGKRRRRAAET